MSRRGEFLFPILLPAALLLLLNMFTFLTRKELDSSFPEGIFKLSLLLGIGPTLNAHRKEMDEITAPFHLMLPVSSLEKFVSRWLLTFGLAFVGSLCVIIVLCNAFALVNFMAGKGDAIFVFPSTQILLNSLQSFFVFHSIYFLGGVRFRKNAFLKTIFSMIGYMFGVFCLFMILLSTGFLKDLFADVSLPQIFEKISRGPQDGIGLSLIKISWTIVLPVLLYISAYFHSDEFEARS
jgi:hypothetical protein